MAGPTGLRHHTAIAPLGAAGMELLLEELAARLGFDPFEYMLLTIGGIVLWIWCSAIIDPALTGRGIWIRWGSIALAAFGAVMFAATARHLH